MCFEKVIEIITYIYIDMMHSQNGEFVVIYHDRKQATAFYNSTIRCQKFQDT